MPASVQVSDIVNTVQALSGHPWNPDEGVRLGPAEREVRKAVVTWMATRDALLHAEDLGADLVIAHESLFYPYDRRIEPGETQEWEAWRTNRQRREIIERAGITLVRVHGSADEICIFDVFADLLGLGEPVSGETYRKIYQIEPAPFRELVERVKAAVGMEHVRVSCSDSDLDKHVHRVGLPWGGLGLFVNVGYQQWALENGCDVLIAGESDSYGFRFSAECDVPMIETSHEISENPGFRRFTEILAEHHPEVAFEFFDTGNSWRWM